MQITTPLLKSTPILKFINEHNQIYHLAVLVVCLLIAFIPPIFNDYGYVDGLYDWGYKACIIATVTGFGYYLFSSEVNVIAALKAGKKTGAVLGGLSSAEKIANSNGVYLDFEGVLLDENGNLKQDSLGAMREMRDNKVTNLNLVCSCGDEKAEEICKNLKIGSYYNRTEEQKADVYSEALNNGGLLVVSSKNSVQGEKGAVVVFNAQQEGFCKNGSVMHGEIAYLPYIIKLAKRTAAINKVNLILGVTVKVALIALALLGIAQMWWAVLADSVVSIITAVLAFVNSSEIY